VKVFVGGKCVPDSIFSLVDPSSFTEAEFEVHTRRALQCVYPEYHCIPFRGAYEFESQVHEADLALVHKQFSHWFVIEVELVSHSLDGHVIPQVRCLRYGQPLQSCIGNICSAIDGMSAEQARSLLYLVPRATAVVTNRAEPEWNAALRGLDTQMLVVSVFTKADGSYAHETEGSLYVPQTSLGFYTYSAVNKTLRVTETCALPEGQIQVEDPFGAVGTWTVRRSEGYLWVTKDLGDPGLPDKAMLQVLRTQTGRITLRLPRL